MRTWTKFTRLTSDEQKTVLMKLFHKYGLMYSITSQKSMDALQRECNEYPVVESALKELMEE